jgi:hypothetical protein
LSALSIFQYQNYKKFPVLQQDKKVDMDVKKQAMILLQGKGVRLTRPALNRSKDCGAGLLPYQHNI